MRDEIHRGPIWTYEQAVFRLLSDYAAHTWIYDLNKEPPNEARLVCDLFWVSESTLRSDLCRAWGGRR